jgi:epoxyqueuosine reductase
MDAAASPVSHDLITLIRERAATLGFDAVGITRPALPKGRSDALHDFVAAGRHGDMAWLARNLERREAPHGLWPETRSVIALGTSYAPDHDPLAELEQKAAGTIAAYARRRDYHDVIKKRLKALGRWLAEDHGAAVKVFVDTAPVLEKPLAERGGIGWQGKHTNLVSRRHGSWLLLGEIFTDLDLPADPPESDHCGSCRRCLDVCPTDAFPQPYQLDARRCISYLTIEHRGHIGAEFRTAIGNRIFGCDDCLAVCPWNRFASTARDSALAVRDDMATPPLAELAALDERAFRQRFAGTPVKRTGRDRFVRNVLIAIGNSDDPTLATAARPHLDDRSPLVRAMAVWALARLLPAADLATLRSRYLRDEPDDAVVGEWRAAA